MVKIARDKRPHPVWAGEAGGGRVAVVREARAETPTTGVVADGNWRQELGC